MANKSNNNLIRAYWHDYKSEVLFLIVLSACTAASHWLSYFISVDFFESVLTPVQNSFTAAVCLAGAWLVFRHSGGSRVRKAWAWALLAWGLSDSFFLLQTCVLGVPVLLIGNDALTAYEMLAGNFLGWLLLVYPTEVLRPGWLTARRVAAQLLPMVVLVGVDYVVPADLSLIISLYPVFLFILVLTHLHAYRVWCEENFSSMDSIDVQWIVRYLFMVLVIGLSYLYMNLTSNPARSFTQQWLLLFVFAYTTEQVLFRKDPWVSVKSAAEEEDRTLAQAEPNAANVHENIRLLEKWMEREKPYLNPDFRLADLRQVLPMNRTYLSQLIHSEYDCSFYQYVNRYRVKEAKRLMRVHPTMKVDEVARCSGFASRMVFTTVFSKETGCSPREWVKKMTI